MVAAVATLDPEIAAEQRAGGDVGMHQPARQPRQPLHERGVHALGHAAAQQDLAEQHEERNGGQEEVVRRAPRRARPWRATAASASRWPRATPSSPMPAATGIASASRPIRIDERGSQHVSRFPRAPGAPSRSRISSSTSSSADRVLISRAAAAQIAGARDRSERASSRSADHDEDHQAGEPQDLRDHGRCLQRRLAARTRYPGLRHHAPAVPGDQREEADEQDEATDRARPDAAFAATGRRANRCGCARGRAGPRRGPRRVPMASA